MGKDAGDARRQRREWLLRVCSQAMQRQQVRSPGACVQPFQVPGGWRPGPGWAGQSSLPGADVPSATE